MTTEKKDAPKAPTKTDLSEDELEKVSGGALDADIKTSGVPKTTPQIPAIYKTSTK